MNTQKLLDALRLYCLRCHHRWLRREAEPKQCPACRSPYWNTPYVRAIAKENRAEARGDKKVATNWRKLQTEAAERRRENWRRASNAYHARQRAAAQGEKPLGQDAEHPASGQSRRGHSQGAGDARRSRPARGGRKAQ